ncbi:MAG: KilA-N domain-containing protein, partial [Wohlfahrtiimonas sp.]
MNLTIQLNAVKVWAGAQNTQVAVVRNCNLCGFFTSIRFMGGSAANKIPAMEICPLSTCSFELPLAISKMAHINQVGDVNMSNSLSIGNFSIRQFDGLYSLNDLHKASGGLNKHKPTFFLRNDQTQALIEEIDRVANLQLAQNNHSSEVRTAIKVKHGGTNSGTYVCKEIAIAYAMWVSASFMLLVIRTFDSVVNNQPQIEYTKIEKSLNSKS